MEKFSTQVEMFYEKGVIDLEMELSQRRVVHIGSNVDSILMLLKVLFGVWMTGIWPAYM